MRIVMTISLLLAISSPPGCYGQAASEQATKQPTLCVVGTAHLDTQWRWTVRETIEQFLPATLTDNFRLFETFPDYVFSFEGSFRYQLVKEYYPEQYEKLRHYIDQGRWRVAGSWVDAVDVNMPSCESLVRQVLYGNGFFEREFGERSRDVFLPDCFGFGYALPSIASHCGLQSFSTQKLSWGSAVEVPFDIGLWEGVDGSALIAALRPGAYVARIRSDLSRDTAWLATAVAQEKVSGLGAAYMYFGTGDTGGAPDSSSVAWLEQSIAGDGPLAIRSIGSDEIVDVIKADKDVELPRYNGELLMTSHAVGCYTSQAVMKRWNRKNELLGDAAERASVVAQLLGWPEYPRATLRDTWVRFLWHQFHDDLTGTSVPEAYLYSWNDEILCQNRFAGVLTGAATAAAAVLDTRGEGVPLVVYNPLAVTRQDVVEATVLYPNGTPEAIRVYAPSGEEVPSQVVTGYSDSLHLLFLAQTAPLSYSVYDVRPADRNCDINTGLSCSERTLTNARYNIRLNEFGDVESVFDKNLGRELLSEPIQLQLLQDNPRQWPAWEIGHDDIMADPVVLRDDKITMRLVETGPVRTSIECVRRQGNSEFRTTISLAAGVAGDRLEFINDVDWYEQETLLKAAFGTSAANEEATYDLGLGTICRGTNRPELYEVPGHQWADLTSADRSYGMAVLNDCKYGWDHPDKSTLRLTLIHTPGVFENWSWVGDQSSQDLGHHRFGYAVCGHAGDWRDGGVVWRAARFNQPLIAFQATAHTGLVGREFSLLGVEAAGSANDNPQVMVNAVKLAEASDEVIVRLRELRGEPARDIRVRFAWPVLSAREVTGVEKPVGEAGLRDGKLLVDLGPYQLKTFALKLAEPGLPRESPSYAVLPLSYNLDGISNDDDRSDGDFDGEGYTLAGELLTDTIMYQGVPYALGPRATRAKNVLVCNGETLDLPAGEYEAVYILLTAVGGPTKATITIGDTDTAIWIQDYIEPLGQWSNRLVGGSFVEEKGLISPAYILREPVAWVGTHRHTPGSSNETYKYTYLYAARLTVPNGAREMQFPADPRVRVLAATVAKDDFDRLRPAQPLYDVADATVVKITAARNYFIDSMQVELGCPMPGAEVHYTTDGSRPTAESPLYTGPFVLASTTTLQARALLASADDSYVTRSVFSRLEPRSPESVADLQPGLNCDYFEGEWSKLPDLARLPVVKQAEVAEFAIPDFARDEDYGLVLSGFVSIPIEGLYDFAINSDDGSALFVCDSLIADNDGIHGPQEIAGAIALRQGLHRIEVHMFQKKGGEHLEVSIQGPGLEKQPLPAEMLFRERR